MQLNHYELYIWWSTFSPVEYPLKSFKEYSESLPKGEMVFFGEITDNGMYIVDDSEITPDFKKWLSAFRAEQKRMREKLEKEKDNARINIETKIKKEKLTL